MLWCDETPTVRLPLYSMLDEYQAGRPSLWAMVADGRGCQRDTDAGGAGGAGEGDAWVGDRVSGSVARCLASGVPGRYSGPRCPQPVSAAALAARAMVLTRIWEAFNMRKL